MESTGILMDEGTDGTTTALIAEISIGGGNVLIDLRSPGGIETITGFHGLTKVIADIPISGITKGSTDIFTPDLTKDIIDIFTPDLRDITGIFTPDQAIGITEAEKVGKRFFYQSVKRAKRE